LKYCMNYTISHKTVYRYFEPVSLCHNIIRLMPRNTNRQVCSHSEIKISPEPDAIHQYEDFFGNKVLYFSINREHQQLEVQVSSVMSGIENQESTRPLTLNEVRQYILETPMTAWNAAISEYALTSFPPGRSIKDGAIDLMQRIYSDFEFKPGFTTISTPLSVVIQERKGVCQDFAHLAIACVRSMGLPARYVSGYIETISPEGQEKLVGADSSHAWFSVYIPSEGWLDLDPTNNLLPSNQHITIGWGRDYSDIAPLRGIIVSSGHHELSVAVDMRRIEQ
jgi:transglutaminase-like putative cysteine protease